MRARLGNVLYWLGCILAALIIAAAIVEWFGEAQYRPNGWVSSLNLRFSRSLSGESAACVITCYRARDVSCKSTRSAGLTFVDQFARLLLRRHMSAIGP
jgi:hypothetical protein